DRRQPVFPSSFQSGKIQGFVKTYELLCSRRVDVVHAKHPKEFHGSTVFVDVVGGIVVDKFTEIDVQPDVDILFQK
ncbi:hypothetical protein, partial [Vibrio parahaemolyticus]|uniref:hypothetical protein n=1 Tax=Vibrio parahaemolyticus TaxID=670 RepID=UPI0021136864